MKANSRGKIYLSIIKLSFITLLITVISITIIFFIGVQFNLNAQIRHTNEATLKQIALDLDNIMVKKAQDAANSLVYQYPEFELIISKKLNGNQIEYKRLMEYLGGVVQYSPQIRSIYVYSDKTNLILSNTIVTDIGNRINAERLDLDWMETVQLDQYSSFWIPSRESKESPGEYSVSYVKTYVSARCAVIINFREDYINRYVGEFFTGNRGSYYITDFDGRIISTNRSEAGFLPMAQLQREIREEYHATLTVAVGGIFFRLTDVSLSYKQAVKALRYTMVFPNESILKYISLDGSREVSSKVIDTYSDSACEIIKSQAFEKIPEFCVSLINCFPMTILLITAIIWKMWIRPEQL